MLGNYLQPMTSADVIFQMHFFGTLRVKQWGTLKLDCKNKLLTIAILSILTNQVYWYDTLCVTVITLLSHLLDPLYMGKPLIGYFYK